MLSSGENTKSPQQIKKKTHKWGNLRENTN